MDTLRYNRGEFTILDEIGRGAFGNVSRARDISSGEEFAVKYVRLENTPSHKAEEEEITISIGVFREIQALRQICKTDLSSLMHGGVPLSEKRSTNILEQTFRGLEFIHRKGIMHRDIKPSNILVDLNDNVKIADFGLARVLERRRRESATYSHQVATRWYRAPELLFGSRAYDESVDVWALGTIMGEMMNGNALFRGENDIDQIYCIFRILVPDEHQWGTPDEKDEPYFLTLPDYNKVTFQQVERKCLHTKILPRATRAFSNIVESLLEYNPALRPTAGKALTRILIEL